MRYWLGVTRGAAVALSGALLVAGLARTASAASGGGASAGEGICRSSSDPALAARIGKGIEKARRGRVSAVAVGVDDPADGLTCWLDGSQHFDSASVVKVIILGALLRRAQDEHRHLTRTEEDLAWDMITRSDNDAASVLWDELGPAEIKRFLALAGMTDTFPGPGPAWGLTQITAYDQILLLGLLMDRNDVLDTASRDYALRLMADVIPSQRWGVPAGAPADLTAHVKNGWLPLDPGGWRVHSTGCFTGHGGGYYIVVLTQDNPTMAYGIDTIEAIARAVNHGLNASSADRSGES